MEKFKVRIRGDVQTNKSKITLARNSLKSFSVSISFGIWSEKSLKEQRNVSLMKM